MQYIHIFTCTCVIYILFFLYYIYNMCFNVINYIKWKKITAMIYRVVQTHNYVRRAVMTSSFPLIKISPCHAVISPATIKPSSYKRKCELSLSIRACDESEGVRLDKLAALNLTSFIPAAARCRCEHALV